MVDYRLDIRDCGNPDRECAVHYLAAREGGAAMRKADRLLRQHVNATGDNAYGELYEHDGAGHATFWDTVHIEAVTA